MDLALPWASRKPSAAQPPGARYASRLVRAHRRSRRI